MRSILFVCTFFGAVGLTLHSCQLFDSKNDAATEVRIPDAALPVPIELSDLQTWTQGDTFYLTGKATNLAPGPDYQQIWLEWEVLDVSKQTLKIGEKKTLVLPLFATALPPRGQSAFMGSWPAAMFPAAPATVRLAGAKGIAKAPGTILLVTDVSGVKMLVRPNAGDTVAQERAWQVTAQLQNPMDKTAAGAVLELLVYGADNRLWYCRRISTQAAGSDLHQEGKGPLQPGETRRIGLMLPYETLPQRLQERKIGKVEILASEDR